MSAFRAYRYLNILSIDVVLGAVCSAAWFAKIFEVTLKSEALVSLGLTVWIIYTTDHLLDARRIKGAAATYRHRYHQRHFSVLLIALLMAVMVDLYFVSFVKKIVFQWGLVLSSVMVIYFLVQRYLKYLKEIIVAILFSCGVMLPSLALSQRQPDIAGILITVAFMLTALLNLLLFSWFDRHNDIRDKRESFVTLTGEVKSKRILRFTILLNMTIILGSIFYMPQMADQMSILFLMNAILIFMFVRPYQFQANDRFRLLGDGVFLLPVIYFFL
jgi:1,4-dihydroxy-2-naphthoate octaprenyltransferase